MTNDTNGAEAPAYRVLEAHRADDLFRAPASHAKWGALSRELLAGNAVFVPSMTRIQLESLRTVLRYRTPHVMLLSRATEVDGVHGRLLRVSRPAK